MADRPSVVLYCEDSGHEQFARAVLARISIELGLRTDVRTASGRGGHGRAMTEFKAWQRTIAGGRGFGFNIPDLLILMIDANCKGWATVRRRQTILGAGQPILTTEMEYAPDLVNAMDFFRAGRNQPSLKHFLEEIRSALQTRQA
ncbi:MAG: hypothetical protein ACJ75H_23670 [Thermoanaerobaculia bacterium]